MTRVQAGLALFVALITIVSAFAKVMNDANAAAVENAKLHEEVHQLRRIIISEFPQYTAAIEWSD